MSFIDKRIQIQIKLTSNTNWYFPAKDFCGVTNFSFDIQLIGYSSFVWSVLSHGAKNGSNCKSYFGCDLEFQFGDSIKPVMSWSVMYYYGTRPYFDAYYKFKNTTKHKSNNKKKPLTNLRRAEQFRKIQNILENFPYIIDALSINFKEMQYNVNNIEFWVVKDNMYFKSEEDAVLFKLANF